MKREKYIAGNWKMNTSKKEALELAKAVQKELEGVEGKFMVAVPFVYIDAVSSALSGSNIKVGAQDVAATKNGAHTGEVSAEMLMDAGASVVILGHSERRHEIGESDALINKKVRRALNAGLEVVLCIGELLSEREAGEAENVCALQLSSGLSGVDEKGLKKITIAYEPVWAIGTGKTATPEEAEEMHKFCRAHLAKLYGEESASSVIIQYGGSMKEENAASLLAKEDIDGGLIGGASLKASSFAAICRV